MFTHSSNPIPRRCASLLPCPLPTLSPSIPFHRDLKISVPLSACLILYTSTRPSLCRVPKLFLLVFMGWHLKGCDQVRNYETVHCCVCEVICAAAGHIRFDSSSLCVCLRTSQHVYSFFLLFLAVGRYWLLCETCSWRQCARPFAASEGVPEPSSCSSPNLRAAISSLSSFIRTFTSFSDATTNHAEVIYLLINSGF